MLSRIVRAIFVVSVVSLVGACSAADGQVWRSHSTHWASGEHAFFSMRNNKDGSNPRVSRLDIEQNRSQNWWGIYAINVNPNQIFQN